jgi:hypothetical protein
MSGKSFIGRLLLCSAFLMVFTGCSHLQSTLKKQDKKPEKVCVQNVRPEDYPEEITRQLDIVENHQEMEAMVDAHLQLVRLYSNVENPKRNIKKAIDHLEKSLSFVPQANIQYEAKDLLAVLKELEMFSKKVQALKQKNKALDDAVKNLKKDNQDLNNKIEKLKALEIRHERKKKSYR